VSYGEQFREIYRVAQEKKRQEVDDIMSTRDLMGSIQSFHDQRQEECEEIEEIIGQEECPDDVYHVQCHHCHLAIDPNEDPVYCWNFTTVGGGAKQIFVCGSCDAEHRARYISLEEEQNG
jgi:hypothetical protein